MYLRLNDPDFWENWPEEFSLYKAEVERLTTSKVALFPLGDIADNPPTVIAPYHRPHAELNRHIMTPYVSRSSRKVRSTLGMKYSNLVT